MFEDDEFDLDFNDSLSTIYDENRLESPNDWKTLRTEEDNHQPPNQFLSQTRLDIASSTVSNTFSFKKPRSNKDSCFNSSTSANLDNSLNISNNLAGSSRQWSSSGQEKVSSRRMFPGPAGLVTVAASPGDKRLIQDEDDEDVTNKQSLLVNENSQDYVTDRVNLNDCVLWRNAVEEVTDLVGAGDRFKFSISWIKKQPSATIVPYFLCKIVRLDSTHKDPAVIFRDADGSIEGSLHRNIVEEFAKDIKVGTVLLVVKAAVLKTVKSVYINLTLNNIVSIFSNSEVQHIREVSRQEISEIVSSAELAQVSRGRVQHSSVKKSSPTFSSSRPLTSSPSAPGLGFISSLPSVDLSRESSLNSVSSVRTSVDKPPPHQPPAVPASSGQHKFKFKSTSSTKFQTSSSVFSNINPSINRTESTVKRTTSEASQCLVASLLSDLDSSDIWADF